MIHLEIIFTKTLKYAKNHNFPKREGNLCLSSSLKTQTYPVYNHIRQREAAEGFSTNFSTLQTAVQITCTSCCFSSTAITICDDSSLCRARSLLYTSYVCCVFVINVTVTLTLENIRRKLLKTTVICLLSTVV